MQLQLKHTATRSTTRACAGTMRTALSPPRCCVCLSALFPVLPDGGSSSAAAGLAGPASSALTLASRSLAFVLSLRPSCSTAAPREPAALLRSAGSASASRSSAAADARPREAAAGCPPFVAAATAAANATLAPGLSPRLRPSRGVAAPLVASCTEPVV